MSARVWATTADGLFQFMSVTSDTLQGGLNVMRSSYFLHEKISIGVELPHQPEAMTEIEGLCKNIAKDGLSLVASETRTGRTVGIIFNKLQVKSSDKKTYFDQYEVTCKYPSSKALVQFLNDADVAANVYELCETNCFLELVFLGVLPEYRRRGIGRKLFELSVALGRDLSFGKNVRISLDNRSLPPQPTPDAISATCTNIISQTCASKLGFRPATTIDYKTIMFKGKSFADRIGSTDASSHAIVQYKALS